MAKEKQETESEIINETGITTELTAEKQGKELITQTNLSSSNLPPRWPHQSLQIQISPTRLKISHVRCTPVAGFNSKHFKATQVNSFQLQ